MSFSEVLETPTWNKIASIATVFGVIVAIIGIIVAVVIYILQKKIKRLTYNVVSNTQLVGIDNVIQDKIKVYYEDIIVENVSLTLIEFTNSGNQTILDKEFIKPITIKLSDTDHILDYEVSAQHPSSLDVNLKNIENGIEIIPLSLNPEDKFTLKILSNGHKENFSVDTRIIGVKEIEEVYSRYDAQPSIAILRQALLITLKRLVPLPFELAEDLFKLGEEQSKKKK